MSSCVTPQPKGPDAPVMTYRMVFSHPLFSVGIRGGRTERLTGYGMPEMKCVELPTEPSSDGVTGLIWGERGTDGGRLKRHSLTFQRCVEGHRDLYAEDLPFAVLANVFVLVDPVRKEECWCA